MRTKYYDVVFIGGSLSGLLCAISLLKKGFKVLILNCENYFYPFDKNGFFSSPVQYFGGFSLRNLLKSLGFHPLEINRLRAVDPSLQVIMPGIRFDLYSDEKRLLGELKREFPDLWGEANNFFNKQLTSFQDLYPKIFMAETKFPPETFFEKRRLKSFVKRLSSASSIDSTYSLQELLGTMGNNSDFLLLLRGIIASVSDLSQKNYSLPYLSQLVNTARFEGYEFDGGLRSFHDLMLSKAKERGAIVLNEASIKEVHLSGRFVDSISLEGCAIDKLVLSYLIIDGNPKSLLKYLPSARKNFILKRRFSKITPKYFKYTFYVRLRGIVYPEGMQERVVLITDKKSELCGDNFLYLEKNPGEKDEKGNDTVVLSVSAYLKPNTVKAESFKDVFAKTCIENISRVIPFMDEHILGVDFPPFSKAESLDRDLRSKFVYESQYEPYFNVTALPYTSYIKNMFLVSQSVFPGLGLDGELQSGFKVSRHIARASKMKRP